MQYVSLDPKENRVNSLKNVTSLHLITKSAKKDQIQEGMSPKEIADIVSDHLIEVVKKQFENAKKTFQIQGK